MIHMIHNFEFDGQDSRDFGLYFVGEKIWKKPERDVNTIHIPGRDGDIIIDNGCYKNISDTLNLRFFAQNITEEYEKDYYEALRKIKEWLVVDGRYHQFIESYNPDYYREIRIKSFEAQQIEKSIANITLSIDCKPYLRRISGDNTIIVDKSGQYFFNPDSETSKPYMKIFPSDGTKDFEIAINSNTYAFYRADEYVEIDSETMNVFKGVINKNNDYAPNAFSTDFPEFQPGLNTISFIGNIDYIEIIPRWRTT